MAKKNRKAPLDLHRHLKIGLLCGTLDFEATVVMRRLGGVSFSPPRSFPRTCSRLRPSLVWDDSLTALAPWKLSKSERNAL